MSIKLMSQVYDYDVPAPLQRVLLVLCDHANDSGSCWPSQRLIAYKLGTSTRTIERAVGDLIGLGAISRRQKPGGTNLYRIHLDRLSRKPPFQTRQNDGADDIDGTDGTDADDWADTGDGTNPTSMEGDPSPVSATTRHQCRPNHQGTIREPSGEPSLTVSGHKADKIMEAGRRAKPKPDGYTLEFEAFWASYPTTGGSKKDAFAAWRKLTIDVDLLQQIEDGLNAWKSSDRWQRGIIKHAATWLNGGPDLWESAPPAANVTAFPNAQSRPGHTIVRGKDIGYSTEELFAMARGEAPLPSQRRAMAR